MTAEEAQQLITEIKNGRPFDNLMFEVEYIEKIITRFANKPPFTSIIKYGGFKDAYFILEKSSDSNDCRISFANHGGKEKEVFLFVNPTQLKDMRDNINKMLEYLDNE